MTSLRPRTPTAADRARLSDAELPPLDHDGGMWPGRHVAAGPAEVFVRTTPSLGPDAEPALLVHGLGGSATNWTDLAGQLRSHLAVEAIDLPGFGRSGPAPDRDYSLRAHARTVVAYLQQARRGPVHLVGNSMGGAVSIQVARQRPDLVRSLTLVSPAVPDVRPRIHPLRSDPRMAALVVPGLGELAMRRGLAAPVADRVNATIELCFGDPARYPARRLEEAVAEATHRLPMAWAGEAFLGSVRSLVREQFLRGRRIWADIRGLQVPSLVVWGDRDRLVAPDLAHHLARALPDSRLLVLEGVGHTAMMEDPVTTARAVLALVEDVRAGGRRLGHA